MDIELGEVIAERWFEVHHADGTTTAARACLGKPRRKIDSLDFYAPYVIEGLGNGKPFYAGGIDGYQALQLAMKMIGAELTAFKIRYKVELRWEGNDGGSLGFE